MIYNIKSLFPSRLSRVSQPSHMSQKATADTPSDAGCAPKASAARARPAPRPAPPAPEANWGTTAATRLLCDLVRQGGLQRADTRLRKSYEDRQNARRQQGVADLAEAVAQLHPRCPDALPALLCAVGKNADIERTAQVAAALHLGHSDRYLPLWRALARHADFTQSHGPHFADHAFVLVLEALPRLEAAVAALPSLWARAAALRPTMDAVKAARSGTEARQALTAGLHALEKDWVYRLFIGSASAGSTPQAVNAAIDSAVVEDPQCRADLQLLAQRCGGRNSLQGTTEALMDILRPAVQRFCAPGDATVAERRARLQADLDAHPPVRAERATLSQIGFALPADGLPRTYTVPVQGSERHTQVRVRLVQDLFGAARCCATDALGGCYAASSGLRSSKPLENGISPASRFITVHDDKGREIESLEVGLTRQGLWIDRFEKDHALDLSTLWGDYLAELVRSGAVPQVVVRQVPPPREFKSPWFAALAAAHPAWHHTGPRVALQRINQLFPKAYYDTQWDDDRRTTYVDASCLVITPQNATA